MVETKHRKEVLMRILIRRFCTRRAQTTQWLQMARQGMTT